MPARLIDVQTETLVLVHAYLDAQSVKPPGAPDTPALKEARTLRTRLEEAFPQAFPRSAQPA